MLQPDVLICCDPEQNKMRARVFGAPSFTAEVLSKSTKSKDRFLKLYKYKNAGVKEYWIIDPEERTVTVWIFDKDDNDKSKVYTFEDPVPVGISEGKCSIRFADADRMLSKAAGDSR